MITTLKWGAMYGQLETDDEINFEPIQLGDVLIEPGTQICRIGSKRRSMFEMQEGFYLQYVGRVDDHLFTSHPSGCSGEPWYYVFAYVDSTTLLIGSAKGCYDVKVDELIIREVVER